MVKIQLEKPIAKTATLDEDYVLRHSAKIVLNKLKECSLLCGNYDAKHGDEHFMYGISTVMEVIANYAGDDEFESMFLKNMFDSEERAGLVCRETQED